MTDQLPATQKYERYLDQQPPAVSSEDLLYKDPEIGLLPEHLEVHELRQDGYEISDAASEPTGENGRRSHGLPLLLLLLLLR